MSVLGAVRPDEWNLPLLLHVFGAMVLVGSLATAVTFLLLGWRRQEPEAAASLARLGFRTLLFVAIPSWILMFVAAQWIASKEGFERGNEPTWITIGYVTAEPGAVLLLTAVVLSGLGARRLRARAGEASTLVRAAGVLATVLVAAYVVAVWAMSAKP